MVLCLGLAGPADGMMGLELVIAYGALLLLGTVLAVSMARRSMRWFWGGIVPLVGITLLAEPWQFFQALSPADAVDPDIVDWHGEYRAWAVWWVVATASAVGAGMWLWRRKHRARRERVRGDTHGAESS